MLYTFIRQDKGKTIHIRNMYGVRCGNTHRNLNEEQNIVRLDTAEPDKIESAEDTLRIMKRQSGCKVCSKCERDFLITINGFKRKQKNTQKLINKFRGQRQEWGMLKGILYANEQGLISNRHIDTAMIIKRMEDVMN